MSRTPQHDDRAGCAAGPPAPTTRPPARRTRTGPVVLGVLVALVGLIGPPSAAAAAPPEPADAAAAASPLTGMEYRTNLTGPDHRAVKDVHATCPAGKVVVGGSVTVHVAEEGGGPWQEDTQISLRASLPNLVPATGRYEWIARASETRTGTPKPWALLVQVRCADRPAGYVFVNKSTSPPSLTSPQVADPVCPAGLVALGGGASVRNAPGGQGVGLQVVRVDALGGLLRTQARTHPGGNPDPWGLTAIALCAQRPQGFQVTDGPFGDPSSATIQKSSVFCQGGRSLVSHGAAIDSSAPGNATLQSIGSAAEIFGNVKAVEHVATPELWGDVLARGVCADVEWAWD